MAFVILPIVSLVLYLIGFIVPNLVLYMAVAGLAVAILSYRKSAQADQSTSKYFSLALVILGVILLVCSILSIFALGPFIASIL